MRRLFGWCADRKHGDCRGQIVVNDEILSCGCECHADDEESGR